MILQRFATACSCIDVSRPWLLSCRSAEIRLGHRGSISMRGRVGRFGFLGLDSQICLSYQRNITAEGTKSTLIWRYWSQCCTSCCFAYVFALAHRLLPPPLIMYRLSRNFYCTLNLATPSRYIQHAGRTCLRCRVYRLHSRTVLCRHGSHGPRRNMRGGILLPFWLTGGSMGFEVSIRKGGVGSGFCRWVLRMVSFDSSGRFFRPSLSLLITD